MRLKYKKEVQRQAHQQIMRMRESVASRVHRSHGSSGGCRTECRPNSNETFFSVTAVVLKREKTHQAQCTVKLQRNLSCVVHSAAKDSLLTQTSASAFVRV